MYIFLLIENPWKHTANIYSHPLPEYMYYFSLFLISFFYVPVLIETSSEAEAEIPLGGPSGPPADDSDSESAL